MTETVHSIGVNNWGVHNLFEPIEWVFQRQVLFQLATALRLAQMDITPDHLWSALRSAALSPKGTKSNAFYAGFLFRCLRTGWKRRMLLPQNEQQLPVTCCTFWLKTYPRIDKTLRTNTYNILSVHLDVLESSGDPHNTLADIVAPSYVTEPNYRYRCVW